MDQEIDVHEEKLILDDIDEVMTNVDFEKWSLLELINVGFKMETIYHRITDEIWKRRHGGEP